MPSFDSSRGRFRLAPTHLSVLGRLRDGEPIPPELQVAQEELQSNGLLHDNAVGPELADLLAVLASPTVLVQAEITGGEGVFGSGAVIGQDSCYVYEGWPGEQECEYVPTDLGLLVWSLARAVGLRKWEGESPAASVITTTLGVLDAGFAALEGMGADSIDEAAERLSKVLQDAGGMTDPDLTVLTWLLLQLNANWRMTVAWYNGKAGIDVRGIAVFDCGPLGYWLRERPAEPILPGAVTPDSELRLVHTDSRRLWELITGLIPSIDEITIQPRGERNERIRIHPYQ